MSRLKWALTWSRSHLDDAFVIAGLLLVAYGLAGYSAPLGPIVIGIGLIAAVRLGSD